MRYWRCLDCGELLINYSQKNRHANSFHESADKKAKIEMLGKREFAYEKVQEIAGGGKGKLVKGDTRLASQYFRTLAIGMGARAEFEGELKSAVLTSIARVASRSLKAELDSTLNNLWK